MPHLRGIFGYILLVKVRTLLLIFLMIAAAVLVINYMNVGIFSHVGVRTSHPQADAAGLPVILWWTPFTGEAGSSRWCGLQQCFFTENRSHLDHPDLKAIVFYGSSFSPFDIPLPRRPQWPLWALLHEESPKNVALMQHEAALRLFNLSATFSRHSHLPLTLQHLPGLGPLTGERFTVPLVEKNRLLGSLAPLVYVHSDCDTPSERDAYVTELMKFVRVDSYGACLNNKQLPAHLRDAMEGMHHADFWHLLAQYKFTLAFENAVCDDYITEKLWRPLIVGSVPVYYGSPSVQDWLPNANSVINIRDFGSPRELAEFILSVNDSAYESLLGHKRGLLSNERLVAGLAKRGWSPKQESPEERNFVEEFECLVCRRTWDQQHSQVSAAHYACPAPVSPLSGRQNASSWWLQQWTQGRTEANVLAEMVASGERLDSEQFYQRVGDTMRQSRKKNS